MANRTTTTIELEDHAPTSEAAQQARVRNHVKKLREQRLLSKAELARKAGLSALTIDRVESGMPCRMDTKRKIILALDMTIDKKDQVFVPELGDDDSADGSA